MARESMKLKISESNECMIDENLSEFSLLPVT